MSYTFQDLLEALKKEEETTLLEILDLTSSDLVDALENLIHDKQERILQYYGEDDETVEW